MKFNFKNTVLALAAFALVGGVTAGVSLLMQDEALVTRADDPVKYSYVTANGETWGTSSGSVKKNGVTWNTTISGGGSYNSANYCGQQFGSKNNSGSLTLTTNQAWGMETGASVYGQTNVSEIRLWLNNGTGTVSTLSVKIDGKECTKTGTVEKNSSAESYLDASLITFTPGEAKSGVISIEVASSAKAWYWCAMEIDSSTGASPATIELGGIDASVKFGDSGTLTYTALDSNADAWFGDVTYSSDAEDVISVDGDAWTALKVGTANITVTADEKDKDGNDVTDTVAITVTDLAKPLTSISELSVEGDVVAGTEKVIHFTYAPTDTDESLVVTSSNTAVLEAEFTASEGNGSITLNPKKAGSATLTVAGLKGAVSVSKEITVLGPSYEGLIEHGSELYIAATRDSTTYYLASNTTSSAPSAVTDIGLATAFTFNLVADNTYNIVTAGGDYLYAGNSNDSVRVGSTADTWVIEAGESTKTGAYNFISHERYLSMYNAQDWRCYTSATAGNRFENTDVVAVVDVDAALTEWIGNYMHMNDADYQGEGTGLCVSAGTYVTAKAALIALGDQCVTAFRNNAGDAYTAALARYTAWAAAAGDTSPFAGEGIISGSHNVIMGSASYRVTAISAVIVIAAAASIGGMVLIAKKRKKA